MPANVWIDLEKQRSVSAYFHSNNAGHIIETAARHNLITLEEWNGSCESLELGLQAWALISMPGERRYEWPGAMALRRRVFAAKVWKVYSFKGDALLNYCACCQTCKCISYLYVVKVQISTCPFLWIGFASGKTETGPVSFRLNFSLILDFSTARGLKIYFSSLERVQVTEQTRYWGLYWVTKPWPVTDAGGQGGVFIEPRVTWKLIRKHHNGRTFHSHEKGVEKWMEDDPWLQSDLSTDQLPDSLVYTTRC